MPLCLVNFAHLDPPTNGGVSRLAREVSLGLLALHPASLRVVFVVRARFIPHFAHWLGSHAVGQGGERIHIIPYTRFIPIPLLLRLVRPDVIVSPLFGVDPFVDTLDIPHIVGLPDTLALDHPELFPPSVLVQRQGVYARAQSAAVIVTISRCAQQQIRHHLPHAAPVVVAALGCDNAISSRDSGRASALIGAPYIFYPANDWPHKRHALLFQAMAAVWRARPEVRLALTGGRGATPAGSGIDLAALIAAAPTGSVVDFGYVSETHLDALYRHADAMLFTSQYEGFGMPLLEAMRAGCPVVCSPNTAIAEVAGDAALYVTDDTPDAWARAYLEQLPDERADQVQRGYARAAQFTWAHTRQRWTCVVLSALDGVFASD